MADRQYFVEGIQVDERAEREYFVEGIQVHEDQPAAPPAGLDIPIAMHHYTKNTTAA